MNLITVLEDTFHKHADLQRASWQKAYMRNQFDFLGISKPLRASLEKEIFKQYPLSTQKEVSIAIKVLLQKNEREYHYAACTLATHYKKFWNSDTLTLFEEMIRTKSWWDTVDYIAVHLVGKLLFTHKELIIEMNKWIKDENIWICRTALLFQLYWKKETQPDLLFAYCKQTMHEKDFFIRKAIGWILREYSKTNPAEVCAFITCNHSFLSALSIREASKYL
jgi:3-methyladenine DNA glycosylase AlkD